MQIFESLNGGSECAVNTYYTIQWLVIQHNFSSANLIPEFPRDFINSINYGSSVNLGTSLGLSHELYIN